MDHPRTYIAIIFVLIALAALWGSRYERQPGPLEMLEEATAKLDDACASLCEGGTVTDTFSLPDSTRMYATEEAICLQRNATIFCTRCGCALPAGELLQTSAPQNITCGLSSIKILCQ